MYLYKERSLLEGAIAPISPSLKYATDKYFLGIFFILVADSQERVFFFFIVFESRDKCLIFYL